MDSSEAVVEGANVGETARQTHAAAIVMLVEQAHQGCRSLTMGYIDAPRQRLVLPYLHGNWVRIFVGVCKDSY
jgi:hypothetical protein